MKLTTFIGTTYREREKFHKEEEAEYAQLKEIAENYEKRRNRRQAKIAKMCKALERMEAKNEYDRKVWNAVMDRCIAHSTRICEMYDELKAWEETA